MNDTFFAEPYSNLRESLVSLPAKPRAALMLRYGNGLTYKEAAEWMGCDIARVRQLEYSALRLLRRSFDYYADRDLLPVYFSKDQARPGIGNPCKEAAKEKRRLRIEEQAKRYQTLEIQTRLAQLVANLKQSWRKSDHPPVKYLGINSYTKLCFRYNGYLEDEKLCGYPISMECKRHLKDFVVRTYCEKVSEKPWYHP